jgi:hypothetical protein
MEPVKGQRKKRFKRDDSVHIRLQERDRLIIEEIYQHRFLNSEQIIRLVGGSPKGVLRRLNLLYHNGYLDRPRSQISLPGNNFMIYGLGNEGARLLAEKLDLILPSVDWTTKNREAKDRFLQHTLMISEFISAVRLACRQVRGVEFVSKEEIAGQRPLKPRESDKAIGWRVEVEQNKRKTAHWIIPDWAFGIRFTAETGRRGVAYFFLEADRATMPIKRHSSFRSSFYRKLSGYYESWRQGLFSENFGFKSPRLLTITMSPERIKSMIEANREIDPREKGMRMFLFAPAKLFSTQDPAKVFDELWLNGRSEPTGLLV